MVQIIIFLVFSLFSPRWTLFSTLKHNVVSRKIKFSLRMFLPFHLRCVLVDWVFSNVKIPLSMAIPSAIFLLRRHFHQFETFIACFFLINFVPLLVKMINLCLLPCCRFVLRAGKRAKAFNFIHEDYERLPWARKIYRFWSAQDPVRHFFWLFSSKWRYVML